eukprot:6114451-Ditylum_brightwellii.AAC.1
MAPSMPALRPEQSWCVEHTVVTSSPHMAIMHLPSMRRRISPTPTGRTPGHLLRAISLPATMAL